RIEDVLGQAPEPHRSELLRALLGIEVEIRGQVGECPCREQYRERFPHDPAVLDDVFPASPQSPTMPPVEGVRSLRLLGSGGFSEVWLAEDLNLFHRLVALKMLRARVSPEKRRSSLEALRNEAELLVNVRHPNLVQVLGWRESEDDPVLVLQYVP